MPLISWIKGHGFITFLILVIVFLVFKDNLSTVSLRKSTTTSVAPIEDFIAPVSKGQLEDDSQGFSLETSPSPSQDSSSRVVIKNSNLSLLVKDVRKTGDQILDFVKSKGGYMVSTSYNRPDESPFATITVRVPAKDLDESLTFFRSLAIKVTSENLVGDDVTEEFTDIKARITTLEKTKIKFESILEKAASVQETLTVQREIINIQEQIDALKGQNKAIEQNAALTKVTAFLSTDELALPYTPDKTFRPNVVFKQAVRSLLDNLRVAGETLIWVGVYSVIWVPALMILLFYKRWRKKRQALSQ